MSLSDTTETVEWHEDLGFRFTSKHLVVNDFSMKSSFTSFSMLRLARFAIHQCVGMYSCPQLKSSQGRCWSWSKDLKGKHCKTISNGELIRRSSNDARMTKFCVDNSSFDKDFLLCRKTHMINKPNRTTNLIYFMSMIVQIGVR